MPDGQNRDRRTSEAADSSRDFSIEDKRARIEASEKMEKDRLERTMKCCIDIQSRFASEVCGSAGSI